MTKRRDLPVGVLPARARVDLAAALAVADERVERLAGALAVPQSGLSVALIEILDDLAGAVRAAVESDSAAVAAYHVGVQSARARLAGLRSGGAR